MEEKKKKKIEKIREHVARLRALITRDSVIGLVRNSGIDEEVVHIVHEEEYLFEDGETDPEDAEIKELHKEIEELKQLAFRDELTETVNRRGFYDRFTPLFDDALYAKQNPESKRRPLLDGFAVIFVDADNFKNINDTHGHDEGDVVLKSIATVLKSEVRDTDAVARFGGEEFVVVLLNATEAEVFEKAEEIRKHLTEKVHLSKDLEWKVTASIGVAALSDSDADTLDELIGYADQAMYEAKANRGKDVVVRHSELV
jgi:diguanylate cyclase (GGDEF)-like protein